MAEKQMKKLPAPVAAIILLAVFVGLLACLNIFTAPMIASNGAAQQYAPLLEVMPEGKDFEKLYDAAEGSSSLTNVPGTVKRVYSEKSGLGYALQLSTTQGYTGNAIELTVAVDPQGKITGIGVNAYPETKDVGEDYPKSFIGQDSALADVGLVAGVTYSSSAIRNAVSDGLNMLVENGMISAGVKTDAQILTELLPSVYSGIVNPAGVLQYEPVEVTDGQFTYIQQIMKALNGAGYAYIVKNGEQSYLAVCNGDGFGKLYNVEGTDVTDDASLADALAEVQNHAVHNTEGFAEKDLRKLQLLLPQTPTEVTRLPLGNILSTVTTVYELRDGDTLYYGFVSRSYGYSNLTMVMYYVLDENGAIVSMTSDELILHKEYFTDYTLDEPSYKAGFAGLTGDTWSDDKALITGATMTSDAVAASTRDVFAAFALIQQHGGDAE